MRRRDWHLLGLAMFASPLVVTGVGAAISHGHTTVAVVVVALMTVLIGHLSIRGRRRPAGRDAPARGRPDVTGSRPVRHATVTGPGSRRHIGPRG